ncbi:MAG: tRNA lysidine(34) synthetase TilS [Candidatus Saccharimonadales bacterium]
MKLEKLYGKYVVAVSGGVDSVVLLDLLYQQSRISNGLTLVVAHFDHGSRSDSSKDLKLVQELALNYKLKFYSKQVTLGPNVSEQLAREARYKFLKEVVNKESADGLITAHHQDDLIETAILNIIRGTGRKGLTSLISSEIIRPLLKFPKTEILTYAKIHKLIWHEDSTNQDLRYLRNYIRHKIIPRLGTDNRNKLLTIINQQSRLNEEIDYQLHELINANSKYNKLPRLWINSLDNLLSKEVLAAWLRQNNIRSFDRSTIDRLSSQVKTISSGKAIDVINSWQIIASASDLALRHVER